jgi:hypothetical protein
MRVLQTHALPLGYRAELFCTAAYPDPHKTENPPASFLVVGRFLVLR